MNITVDESNVESAVLSLVVALVEIVHELLCRQAVKRMGGDTLSGEDCERLGSSLMAMEGVLVSLKRDHGIADGVSQIREGLDSALDRVFGSESLQEEEVAAYGFGQAR